MIEMFVLAGLLMQQPSPLPSDGNALEGDWAVQEVDHVPVMSDAPVWLIFRGTRVSGHASCNSFQGSFRVDGRSLTMESIMTTMKACDSARMGQERDFLSLLRAVRSYSLAPNGTLRLLTDAGKTITARKK